jgi:hypothetical protein
VVEGVFEQARRGSGFFREPSEIRLFQAFHQRRRCAVAATRGHKDGRSLLGTMLSASSFLGVRIFHSFIAASRPPAQPSGLVPGRHWGGAGVNLQAVGGVQGPDCLCAILVRVVSVKVWGHVVFSFSYGPLCKITNH